MVGSNLESWESQKWRNQIMQKISFERLHFCPFDYVWAYWCCGLSKLFAFLQYFTASYVEHQIPLALYVLQSFVKNVKCYVKPNVRSFWREER